MELPIYIYNGIRGLLIDEENEKITGIEPVSCGITSNFYALDSLPQDIEEDDCCLTYDDVYIGEYCGEESILNENVINFENEDEVVTEWITESYYNRKLAEETLMKEESPMVWPTIRSQVKDDIQTAIDTSEDLAESLRRIEKEFKIKWQSYDTFGIDLSSEEVFREILQEVRSDTAAVDKIN